MEPASDRERVDEWPAPQGLRETSRPVSDVLAGLTRRIHAGELQPDPANLDLVGQRLEP